MKVYVLSEQFRNDLVKIIDEGVFPNVKSGIIREAINSIMTLPELVQQKDDPQKDDPQKDDPQKQPQEKPQKEPQEKPEGDIGMDKVQPKLNPKPKK